ncbi:CASP-like protein [Musa troglodytarum]|uniref:CASP-like protein n=1 Tax=Musa troglodytarum TaxID=320322 RepID=A0A9E7KF42_9LILI|nr:CASP-like protein [Musa troglodytarum]
MKVVVGSPGTWSGLLLRTGQCVFAGASIGVMVSALGFSNYTAFCYLIASMGLQVLWSLGLACLDVYALKIKRDLHNPVLVSLFVVGDWVRNLRRIRVCYMAVDFHVLISDVLAPGISITVLMVPDIAFGNHMSCPRCWLWRSKLWCRSTLAFCNTLVAISKPGI